MPGGGELRSQFGRQTFDVASDENSIVFRKKDAAAFRAFKEAVEAAIAQSGAPASQAADPMDQLRRLGELRDAGLITPQELEAKKSELLFRM
jgi:Short C-terminal domain